MLRINVKKGTYGVEEVIKMLAVEKVPFRTVEAPVPEYEVKEDEKGTLIDKATSKSPAPAPENKNDTPPAPPAQ